MGMTQTSLDNARAAKDALAKSLAGDQRVAGIGIAGSKENYVVKVNLVDSDDRPDLPDEVCGVSVRTTVVGRVRAHTSPAW